MVNSGDQPAVFELDLPGVSLPKEASAWTIQNDDPEAYNVPGEDPQVTIVESVYPMKKQRIEVPSYGIMLLKFEI
jgi:hypothetical protein